MASVDAGDLEAVKDEFAAFVLTSWSGDPFPLFRRLRAIAPVHRSALDVWVVVGFPEAEQLARSRVVRREPAAAAQFRPLANQDDPVEVVEAVETWLSKVVFRDPPAHDRLRRLIARAFTPRAVEVWRPHIERVVSGLVDEMLDEREVDFMTAFAFPLPERVICDVLGVPAEDHELWSAWFRAVIEPRSIWTRRGGDDVGATGDVRAAAQHALVELQDYFSELVREQRRRATGTDLFSRLVATEADGDRLSEQELVATLIMLVGAGHTTTAHLLGNGLVALLEYPDALDRLRADPAVAGDAVEEMLRYRGPSRGQPYVAVEELALGDAVIPAGDHIYPYYNAANRDPRRFADPERFDISRADAGHLAFGGGIHYCVGASLARLEAEIAFAALAGRVEPMLLTSQIEWKYAAVHGPMALPVRVDLPAAADDFAQ